MWFTRWTRGIAADGTNLFEGAIGFVKTMLPCTTNVLVRVR
jgi:hypothetical protein